LRFVFLGCSEHRSVSGAHLGSPIKGLVGSSHLGLVATSGCGNEFNGQMEGGVRLWDLASLSLEDVLPHEHEVGDELPCSFLDVGEGC